MGRKSAHKLPQFVETLVATGVEALASSPPINEVQARQVMEQIARSICWQYAKTILYIPAFKEADLSERDAAILKQYGEDGPDGARKFSTQRVEQIRGFYDLTMAHTYAIISAQQKKQRLQAAALLASAANGRHQVEALA